MSSPLWKGLCQLSVVMWPEIKISPHFTASFEKGKNKLNLCVSFRVGSLFCLLFGRRRRRREEYNHLIWKDDGCLVSQPWKEKKNKMPTARNAQ